jgi:hypothetical protein
MSVCGPVYGAFVASLALAASGVLIALEIQASIILTAGNHLASGEQDILLGSGDTGTGGVRLNQHQHRFSISAADLRSGATCVLATALLGLGFASLRGITE